MYRGAIYFIYDRDGVVDDFVVYFLDDFCKHIDELVVVCNGNLSDSGKNKLLKYTEQIIVRENKGLDVAAYKKGLEVLGWDRLDRFDEVILLNNTIMGPVYPFEETFSKMDSMDVDFWGITRHYKATDFTGQNPYGYIPEHIQSHFIACRKNLLLSPEFMKHWQAFGDNLTYQDSVGRHESVFTKKFSDLGFKWAVSVDDSCLKDQTLYPLMDCSYEMVVNRRCPIFKRRMFFHDFGQLLETTTSEMAKELIDYLDRTKLYDVDLIWQNVLRTIDHSDLAKNLHLNYVLSASLSNSKTTTRDSSAVLMVHMYYPDTVKDMFKYLLNVPSNIDIVLSTDSDEKANVIKEYAKQLHNSYEVRVIKNRGRDVSALLVGGKDLISKYDYLCFVHDKKVTQEKVGSIGSSFAYICYENTIANKEYITNVLNLFDENPRLGLLCPPRPLHGPYMSALFCDAQVNFEPLQELCSKLKLQVPISKDKLPIAPYGTCFWMRTSAVKALFDYNWKYEDFPEEPIECNGTLLHAIERVYPYVAQSAGYYSAQVMSDRFAPIQYDILMQYMFNFGKLSYTGFLHPAKWQNTKAEAKLRRIMRVLLPKKLFEALINFKRRLWGPHTEYKYEQG